MAQLYFYYSAMNAGKSTTLLQSNYNYKERGMNTILFAPTIDTRYKSGKISSRIGLESDAVCVNDKFNMYDFTKSKVKIDPKLACVLVDEAQFLSREHVQQLTRIVDELKIPVLAYGLRIDFQGNLFPGSQYLMSWADNLIEVKTVCHCGRKATFNMRIDEEGKKLLEGEQVAIGGNEMYIATCRKHFMEGSSGIYKTEIEHGVSHLESM